MTGCLSVYHFCAFVILVCLNFFFWTQFSSCFFNFNVIPLLTILYHRRRFRVSASIYRNCFVFDKYFVQFSYYKLDLVCWFPWAGSFRGHHYCWHGDLDHVHPSCLCRSRTMTKTESCLNLVRRMSVRAGAKHPRNYIFHDFLPMRTRRQIEYINSTNVFLSHSCV